MKFGVHNHYNNNFSSIGVFNRARFICTISEYDVGLTDAGLTIFNLGKRLELDEKLALADLLNKALVKKFGVGLSFATCGSSDCVEEWELAPYYAHMKAINPEITTIYTSSKFPRDDKWISCPDDLVVDHIVDSWARDPATAEIITSIVSPSDADKLEPAEGWQSFEDTLENIFTAALEEVKRSKQQPVPAHSFAGGPV